MSTNVFARLRALLPQPAVLVGLVVAHNADDTSTIELPLGIGLASYGPGVAAGSLIRARGTQVPVGQNAFVRAGVVESQAPSATPTQITIGASTQACTHAPMAFSGPIPNQTLTVGSPFTLDLTPFFVDGFAPRAYALSVALPAGLALDSATGVLSGTPSGAFSLVGVTATCTDSTGVPVASGLFNLTAS